MARDSFAAATARLQSTVVKAITGYYRLQDFVHAIRGCKTLGEERTLVVRESAAIRTSFKASETSAEERYHAVAKLLFIHMMGYPAHFGQVESLKMVASPRLSEKRLGYLGSEQLIDETQATLTLITNSMKSDLSSSNPTVSAVAIANLTLTASPDLARDLADEIQHLLQTASPYLRKKAAFCAGRLVRKVPDLADLFESAIYTIVSDKNHGVLLGAISLIESLISVNPMYIQKNRERLIPFFVQHLQNIASSGNYNSDYDVAGVCDPFLQVHILRLMRELSAGDITCSLSIADVLTQVATCTDSSRNSGHAVLYETAVTIMGIEGDAALEAMAVGILGKLLASPSSDPNLRYVLQFIFIIFYIRYFCKLYQKYQISRYDDWGK